MVSTKTWIAGLALTALVPLAGCGNAANNAGNAVGNAAGFAGNEVANGVRQGANAVGNTVGNVTGMRPNQGNNGAFGGNVGNVGAMAGSHSIQVDNATKTIHIVMANQAGNGNNSNRAGVMGGTTANNYGGMHITIPTGWTVRLTGSRAGGDTISMVPYNSVTSPNGGANAGFAGGPNAGGPNAGGINAGGRSAGAAGFGANGAVGGNNTWQYHAEQNGDVGGHNPYGVPGARTPGSATNNNTQQNNNTKMNQGTNNMGTQVLRVKTDGTFAIVYSHPGRRDQVLDVITVSKNARVPSFSTDRNF